MTRQLTFDWKCFLTSRLGVVLALIAFACAAQADVLIATNSVWRFQRGTNEASGPSGTEWRTNSFDDSSWETASAPFYFGANYVPTNGTLLSDMQSNYTCIFLRSTFVVPDGLTVVGLSNRPYADDGYILWVNGVEVQRRNMFGSAGQFLPYTTNANIATFTASWFNNNSFTNALRPGTNVVAYQVFNYRIDDTDFFANPEIAVAVIDTTPPRVVSAIPPFGATVSSLTQVTVTFNRAVTGVSENDFVVSGEPATSVTGSNTTYTFAFPPPAATNVAISWDVNHTIVNAAGVRMIGESNAWTYTIVDTAAPVLSQITPAPGATVGSLASLVATFDESVAGVDAADLLINGSPATSAFGSGRGPYTFQFTQPATGAVSFGWAPGHDIRDNAGNAFAGSNWTINLNPQLFTGDVIINEFVAANIFTNAPLDIDEFNHPEDWIELYNRGTNPVRLLGWSLSDDADSPGGTWTFPDVTITNGQYLLVYASGLDRRTLGGTNRLHTNFKLNPFGSYLALYNAEYPPRAVSEFAPEYPEQRNDYSYGLTTNGWRYFVTPTPGGPNGNSTITQVLPKPAVNVARGYFDKPFTFIATCDWPTNIVPGTLRYTTDGSEPTAATGLLYPGPFTISNSTVLRIAAFASNALPSKAATHSYLFLSSIFTQPNNPGTNFPTTFGTQGAFISPSDYEMDPEILTNALYANLVTNALLSLPVVSLAIKPADMWDPTIGIYTHPLSRGVQWERPCSIEFFTPDGAEDDFQEDCGLQIQGNASREPLKQPKHPLKVQFKGDYGPANLKRRIFHDSPREEFDSINLRVDFNFSWLHWDGNQRARGQRTRDAWMKDSMRALGGLAGHNRYVHLFINGLYWGVSDPSERPDASFAAAYLGGEKEEYDAINEAQTAVDGDTAFLNQMLALPAATTVQRYDDFKRYLDVTQFIDYLTLHFFVGHEDWGYRKNFYAVHRRVPGETFKYIPWDGENILGADVNRNDVLRSNGGTGDTTGTPSELQPKLMASSQYRLDFADRVHKHFFNNGALMPTNTIARWMNRAKQIDLAIILESARWGDYRRDVHVYQNPPYELYTRNNQWLTEQSRLVNTYFPQRTAIVLAQLRAIGLYPGNTAPVFNQHGGRIAPGFALTMIATNTIYYTLNGADPRVYGSGAVSPVAQVYSGPVTLNESVVVKARMLAGTNWSALNEATFVVGSLGVPLRFTEIMYNPIGGDAYEYLELQNIGTTPLDLGNYYFNGITFTFPVGFTLDAGKRIVLGNSLNTNAFVSRYPGVTVAGWFGGALANNNGEALTLYDSLNRVVTSVTFNDRGGWPSSPDGGGYSLELIDANGDPDDAANWQASGSQNGTPGQANSVAPAASIILNEVMADNASAVNHEGTYPDYVELFNPTANAIDLTSWSLTDDSFARKYVFPNGTTIPAGGYLVVWCDTNTVTSGLHSGFALGRNGETVSLYDAASLRVDSISYGPQIANHSVGRVNGAWTLTTASPGVANSAVPLAPATSLTINEWLADSVPGGDDFVELFNTNSSAPVALHNLYLGVTNEIYQIKSLSFIAPRGYLALLADGNAGADHLGFKLPAAGGTIVLYDDAGAELQRVTYGTQSQGVSQGRLPDGATNIVLFPGSVSPGTTNYVINYTGPVLNEVLARNAGAVSGPWGNYPDYVELWNPQVAPFNLGGMGLSDEAGRVKFVFAPGTSIPANGYVIVWCDGERPASSNAVFNSGFSLSSSGGGAYLFNAAAQFVNFVEYGFQVQDLPIGISGGAWRLLNAASPGAVNGAPATLGAQTNVRINEWMAAGDGDDWFELYNLDPLPVALSGLFVTDTPSLAGLSNTPIAALSFIGGNSFVKWIADGNPSQGPDHARFDLDRSGDMLRIYAPDFSIIDTVSFGAQVDNVSEGRLPDGAANIVSFPTTASPDASNYLPLSDIVISEALSHTDPPFSDSIEIQNVGPASVDISGWFLSDSQNPLQKFRIPPGPALAPGAFRVFTEADFNAGGTGTGTNFTLNSAHGDSIYLSQADGGGNLTGYRAQVSFGAAENGVSFGRIVTSAGADFTAMVQRTFGASNGDPKVGPVVINEIMFHPNSGGNEYGEEEFIELYNMSGVPVTLFDAARPTNVWQLRGGVSFNFSSNNTLQPNGSLVLVSFDPSVNGTALLNFRAKYGTNGTIVGPFSGRLNNAGESVELYKPDAPQAAPSPDTNFVPMILVDRVEYGGARWANATNAALLSHLLSLTSADGGGASLQRVEPTLYGNEPLNWKAEPPTAGAINIQGPLVAPTIFAQPSNRSVALNGTASFTVAANGSVPLDYQWQHAGAPGGTFTNLPGANSATLVLASAQLADAGVYRVVVTNLAGSIISQEAALTVLAPPVISVQPQARTAVAGTMVQLTVVASGTAPLSYQWRREPLQGGGPVLLAGQTGPQLSLNNVQPANEGIYSVVITNVAGAVTSAPAALIVLVAPAITSDPSDVTVFDGDSASFTVSATGTAPLAYQWRKDSVNIPGATSATYTIAAAHAIDEGVYSVFVTNAAGNATSLGAQLRVNVAPFLGQPRWRQDGGFEFRLNGATNRAYTVEFTTSFNGWTNLTNMTLTSPQTLVIDAGASNAPARFYRVRTP